MLPISKPLLILGALVAALLLVQTVSAPYEDQIQAARESAAIQAEQTQAATQASAAAAERAARAQRTKEEATHAATQQSDFDDVAPDSLVVFVQRLLGDG